LTRSSSTTGGSRLDVTTQTAAATLAGRARLLDEPAG
jgi:hypothetical protein